MQRKLFGLLISFLLLLTSNCTAAENWIQVGTFDNGSVWHIESSSIILKDRFLTFDYKFSVKDPSMTSSVKSAVSTIEVDLSQDKYRRLKVSTYYEDGTIRTKGTDEWKKLSLSPFEMQTVKRVLMIPAKQMSWTQVVDGLFVNLSDISLVDGKSYFWLKGEINPKTTGYWLLGYEQTTGLLYTPVCLLVDNKDTEASLLVPFRKPFPLAPGSSFEKAINRVMGK